MTPSMTIAGGEPRGPDGTPPAKGRHPLLTIAGLGLAAGWGALTCYALLCLGTGPEHQAQPAFAGGFGPSLSEVPSDIMRVKAARRLAQPEPEPEAPPPAAEPLQQTLAPAPTDPGVIPNGPHPAKSVPPEYVGTWGPTPAACAAKARRRGYLPATIKASGATAGGTTCTFRDIERDGSSWVMGASCSEGDRRWSSKVKLLVAGDRLTWTSGKGTSSYVRCPRRDS